MSYFGRAITRVEDPSFLSGTAQFVDDRPEARDALHLVVARSAFAHAVVRLGAPGARSDIALAIGPDDVAHLQWQQLLPDLPPLRPLAGERARYHGQPIAAFAAETARAGIDAVEALDVEYDVLPAAATLQAALRPGAPLVYEQLGTNVAYVDDSAEGPTAAASGETVIARSFSIPRIAPAMLECRALLAVPDGRGLVVYAGHQNAHKLHGELASLLGLSEGLLRVVVPAVGGGFGAKSPFYPEYALAAHAALALGRPVKFIESRSENLLTTTHGRGQHHRAVMRADASGRLLSLDVEAEADFGAAADIQRWCVALTRRMLSGAYRIPEITWRMRGVLTHTPPVGPFRGAGRPEAAYLIERLLGELARETGIDPVDLRRRNFVDQGEFPYRSPAGATYDSGNYGAALDTAVRYAGYAGWKQERDLRRARGDAVRLGVGVASVVEMTAGGGEYGAVAINARGEVEVATGTSPHGQGHQTAWAQLAADHLGVAPERINVRYGDTGTVPRGGGTSGSRSSSLGGSAVSTAARRLAERIRELAAEALEAAPDDIRLVEGRAVVAGTDVGVDFASLAQAAPGGALDARCDFEAPGQTFPFGSAVCVVEVDAATGSVEIIAYTSVDDCGRVINPLLVEGQILGGMLQGLSLALHERVEFDDDGIVVTGNLSTYHVPHAREMPPVTALRTETPSPNNPLGVKGVGELGTTCATPAVVNAVVDALSGLGADVSNLQIPLTPSRLWTAMSGGGK